MCLIIHNPRGERYNPREIRNARGCNSDGFGVMWVENGKVQTYRGLIDSDEILKILATLEGVANTIHLRFATHGPAVQDLCHPFKVTPDDADHQAYLMHNGVLFDQAMRAAEDESDTLIFARELAEDVRAFGTSDILFTDDYIGYMERTITGDKVIITRDDGATVLLNRDRWHEDEKTGMLYSNLYSIEDRKSSYSSSRGSKYAWMDNYRGSLNKFVSKRGKGTLSVADEQAMVEEQIHEQAEADWAEAFAKLPHLLPENAGEGGEYPETTWSLEEGLRQAVDSTEADDELETLYFRWDYDLEEFLPCGEDDEPDVEIDAAEYFAMWEQHEYNDTATVLAYLSAQAQTNGGGSDEYHNQIDDFLNEWNTAHHPEEGGREFTIETEDD